MMQMRIVLMVSSVVIGIICLAVGLKMMPLYRGRFSDMTAEERRKYFQGLAITIAGFGPILLIMYCFM